MAEVVLLGEPMAMFVADTVGPLEEVEHFTRSLAGAEVNVCTGLTRLGYKTTYVTKLGADPFGRYITAFLNHEGIGTEFVTVDAGYPTAFQLKSKVLTGDPEVVYYRRNTAASRMSPEDIDGIDFTGVRHVHVTGIPPALSLSCRQATYRLIERAKAHGIFVTFDPNLRPALWESREVMVQVINDLASQCDMMLPGIGEGLILTGSDQPERIADFYQKLNVTTVIVKMGPRGAYVRHGEESYTVPGFTVEKVVDTVGAGDGFAVGVISGRLQGLSLRDSVIRANAIGAMQVMVSGDNEGLPTPEQLQVFLTERGQ